MPPRPAGAGLSRKPCGREGSCAPGPPACLSAPHTRQSWGCCVLPAASLAHLLQNWTPPPKGKAGRAKGSGPSSKGPGRSPHLDPGTGCTKLSSWEDPGQPLAGVLGGSSVARGAGLPLLGAQSYFSPSEGLQSAEMRRWTSLAGLAAVPKARVLWPPRSGGRKAMGWSNRPFSALGCLPSWATSWESCRPASPSFPAREGDLAGGQTELGAGGGGW